MNRREVLQGLGTIALTSAVFSASSSALASDTGSTTFVIADNVGNRVSVIDVDGWTISKQIDVGLQPYPVDRVTDDIVLVSTRGEENVGVVAVDGFKPMASIPLPHTPRSSAGQRSTNRVLVAGGNRPMTTVLDFSGDMPTVIGTVGTDANSPLRDFGGGLASGHPAWVDGEADEFFVLDRIARRLHVYSVGSDVPVYSQNLPSSAHHIEAYPDEPDRWYVCCEGSRTHRTPPSVVELVRSREGFTTAKNMILPIEGERRALMGAHHLTLHPNGTHIYVGSAEGFCYVLDRNDGTVVSEIEGGLGLGHVTFDPTGTIGVTTNHDDTFVSILDGENHRLIENVEVSFKAKQPKLRHQGHTSMITADGRYFVHSAANDGDVYRLNLETRSITDDDRLFVGGYPIQGDFVKMSPR